MTNNSLIQRSIVRQKSIQAFAFIIAVSLCVLLSVCFAGIDFSASSRPCEIILDEQINPNNAPAASMVRLPGIGITRADAIVAYRDNSNAEPVFQNCDDLQKVKGIGPKTAQKISQWLRFE